jgi:hypothetical protein
VSFCDTVPPTPVPPPRRASRKRMRAPSKGVRPQTPCPPGRHRDVRPAERVFSVTSGPVWPSPPLCHHPGHCRVTPALWKPRPTGRRHICCCASSDPPSAKPSNWCTYDDRTGTPALLPLKSSLDRHRSHHDTCQGQDSQGRPSNRWHCGPCRHTALKVPRHDCKPPPLGL